MLLSKLADTIKCKRMKTVLRKADTYFKRNICLLKITVSYKTIFSLITNWLSQYDFQEVYT